MQLGDGMTLCATTALLTSNVYLLRSENGRLTAAVGQAVAEFLVLLLLLATACAVACARVLARMIDADLNAGQRERDATLTTKALLACLGVKVLSGAVFCYALATVPSALPGDSLFASSLSVAGGLLAAAPLGALACMEVLGILRCRRIARVLKKST